jgi:SPP1 gp7 family putative phage head morphogenesis protein
LTASERREILWLHHELEVELTRLVIKIDPSGASAPSYKIIRQNKLLEISREEIKAGYREIRDTQQAGLVQLAEAEAEWFIKTTNTEVGFNILTKELSSQQLRAIAGDTLIQGAPSKEWWGRQAGGLQEKFSDKVRLGMLQGNTTDEIVRSVRGTKAAGFADGIMEGSRRQIEATVRTSVQAVANEARIKLIEENSDVYSRVKFLATLDDRTSQKCIALNGLVWKLPDYEPDGHNIKWPGHPPVHWNCRSTTVGVTKSFAELAKPGALRTEAGGRSNAQAIFERNLRESGMSEEKIAKAVFNAKASMDGQVPAEFSFADWLKGKDKAFQDDLLGVGKADLWREGKITLGQLINQDARPLTLAELKAKYG